MSRASQRRSVGHAATILASGTLLSRVLGLFRDSLIAALFPRLLTDAWLVAFRIPNFVRRLLQEGALHVSFIPTYLEQKEKGDAQRLSSEFFTLTFVLLSVATVLLLIGAPVIVRHFVPGFEYQSVVGKTELTIRWTQMMAGYVLLVWVSTLFTAILNAEGRFGVASLAPALWNSIMIVFALLPREWAPVDGDFLAWGVVAGGCCQVGILIPRLRQLQLVPRWIHLGFRRDSISLAVRSIMRSILPGTLGLGLMQFTLIANTFFASQLREGTHSWFFWADRILELPLSLFAVSVGTALLPQLARINGQSQRPEFAEMLGLHLRGTVALAIPASVGLFFVSEPLVDVVFRRGAFHLDDLRETASVLRIYSGAIIAFAILRIILPAYYARKHVWFPAITTLFAFATHIGLASIWIRSWGAVGLAAATVVSGAIQVVLLIAGYWQLGYREKLDIVPTFVKSLFATTIMGVVLFVLTRFEFLEYGFFFRALYLGVLTTVGLIVYFAMARLLGFYDLLRSLRSFAKSRD